MAFLFLATKEKTFMNFGVLIALAKRVIPVFKRKGVQMGIATAVSGAAAKIVGDQVVTSQNVVDIIDAVSNVIIAVGTVVAAWKGRCIGAANRTSGGARAT